MNTVFKFYMQVWVMWGVVAAASLPIIAARLQLARPMVDPIEASLPSAAPLDDQMTNRTAYDTTLPVAQPTGGLKSLWWSAFIILFAACLLYPILATRAKIDERFDKRVSPTLNGMAYMTRAVYYDRDQPIVLDWDRQAIEWLQNHLPGSPVILEANAPLYHWGSRISIYTGLPTVVGWDWHQKQQRAIMPGGVVERRLSDVNMMYDDPDPETTLYLLKRYGVEYIYVGPLERIYYGAEGLSKFERYRGIYWDVVYENQEVKIYRVLEASSS